MENIDETYSDALDQELKAMLADYSPDSGFTTPLLTPSNSSHETSFRVPLSAQAAEVPVSNLEGHIVSLHAIKPSAMAVSPYLSAEAIALEAQARELLAANNVIMMTPDGTEEDQTFPNSEATPITESLSSGIDPGSEAGDRRMTSEADDWSFNQDDVDETVEIEYECASNAFGLTDSSGGSVIDLEESRADIEEDGGGLRDYVEARNNLLGVDPIENGVPISCKQLYSVEDNFNVSQLQNISDAHSECVKIDLRNTVFVCGTKEIQETAIQNVKKFFAGFPKLEELILAGPVWMTTDVTFGGFELQFPTAKRLVLSSVPHFPNGFHRMCVASPNLVCLMIDDYSGRFSKFELLNGISSFLPRLTELTLCLEASKFLPHSSSFSNEKSLRRVEQRETMFSVGLSEVFLLSDDALCHILRCCKELKLLIADDGKITTAGLKNAAAEGKNLEVFGLFNCELSLSTIYSLSEVTFQQPRVLFLLDYGKYNDLARSVVEHGVRWLLQIGRVPEAKAHHNDLGKLLNLEYVAWKEKFWSLQILANEVTDEGLFWNIRKPNACAFVLASVAK